MSEKLQTIHQLAALLQDGRAEPVIVPSRLAPSAIYDVEYRTAIVSLVFERFAKPTASDVARRMSSARLKLLQFITLRPWLLSVVRQWSEAGKQSGFAFSHSLRIRRGFLSDSAHDDVINYLIACGRLKRFETQIVSGTGGGALTKIVESIREHDLFSSERGVIELLAEIKITNEMLEGW
ncbi:MAG: hypothetical protein ABSF70_12410 [Terracidiphilus sp.]|jgi:hypothetical protein